MSATTPPPAREGDLGEAEAELRASLKPSFYRMAVLRPSQSAALLTLLASLRAENGRLTDAMAEIARIRLATNEGTLRERADRMWSIAEDRKHSAALAEMCRAPLAAPPASGTARAPGASPSAAAPDARPIIAPETAR